MLLETRPRLRGLVALIPAAVLLIAVINAAATDSWGDWTVGILIGLGWFAVWLPIQVTRPSTPVLYGIAVAAFGLLIAGVAVWLVYTVR